MTCRQRGTLLSPTDRRTKDLDNDGCHHHVCKLRLSRLSKCTHTHTLAVFGSQSFCGSYSQFLFAVNFRSSLRLPLEISYRPQVDESQDDGSGRMLPHPASPFYPASPLYWPSVDVVINARPSDATEPQDLGAVGGIPSLLANYDMYVGIPDVKPSHAHRITRDSPLPDYPQDAGGTTPVLPH